MGSGVPSDADDPVEPAGAPVGPSEPAPHQRRRRPLRWLVAILSLTVLLGATGVWTATGRPQIAPSGSDRALDDGGAAGPAPEVVLPSLTEPSATVALADYRGQPVVVNFWASWCVPCRREMPRLDAAARRFSGQVAFLGVSYQDNGDDALALVEETGVSYPSGVDEDGAGGAAFGLYGLPTTVFITAEGEIASRHVGELDEDTLNGFLDDLVAAR